MLKPSQRSRVAPWGILAALLAACSPPLTVEIQTKRTTSDGGDPARAGATSMERFGRGPAGPHGGQGAPATSRVADPGQIPLEWDVPEGWEVLPESGMRLANLRPGGHADAECSLIILPGSGGGLVANLNRWCEQIGHEPLDEAAIEALPVVTLLGMPATLLELEGDYSGMEDEARAAFGLRGVVLPTEDFTVFVKMTGPADVIRAEADAFDAFCASLRGKSSADDSIAGGAHSADDGHDHGDPHEGAATTALASSAVSGSMRFELPAGWKDLGPKSMRTVNLVAGEETQCYVIELAGEAGGELANLNRWRGEVGLEALTAAEVAGLERIDFLGESCALLEVSGNYAGMGGGDGAGRTILGTLLIGPTGSAFIKMVGPSAEVSRHREAFLTLCASMEPMG